MQSSDASSSGEMRVLEDTAVAKRQMEQNPYFKDNKKLKCNQMLVNRTGRVLENTAEGTSWKERGMESVRSALL